MIINYSLSELIESFYKKFAIMLILFNGWQCNDKGEHTNESCWPDR